MIIGTPVRINGVTGTIIKVTDELHCVVQTKTRFVHCRLEDCQPLFAPSLSGEHLTVFRAEFYEDLIEYNPYEIALVWREYCDGVDTVKTIVDRLISIGLLERRIDG